MPRVRAPDGSTRLVEPDWAGKLAGSTLLFEALIIILCREMTFAAVSRLVNPRWHWVTAICARCVDMAADETSRARGHDYVRLFADVDERKSSSSPTGPAPILKAFAEDLTAHEGDPEAIESVSIYVTPAFTKRVAGHPPNGRITFDKFHVIAHVSNAADKTRRIAQRAPGSTVSRCATSSDESRSPWRAARSPSGAPTS